MEQCQSWGVIKEWRKKSRKRGPRAVIPITSNIVKKKERTK